MAQPTTPTHIDQKYIDLYKAATNDIKMEDKAVVALGNPPYPGLRIFKIFLYLLQRIEAVALPSQAQIDAAVNARIEIIRGELARQFERQQARLDLRAARHTVPAIPPRDREPQA